MDILAIILQRELLLSERCDYSPCGQAEYYRPGHRITGLQGVTWSVTGNPWIFHNDMIVLSVRVFSLALGIYHF